jgi:hypothetical protein
MGPTVWEGRKIASMEATLDLVMQPGREKRLKLKRHQIISLWFSGDSFAYTDHIHNYLAY